MFEHTKLTANMDKTIQIQTQIRHNAEEISAALSEMGKWEKQMKNRDGNIKTAHQKAARVPRAPIRSGVGTVPVQVNDVSKDKPTQAGNADSSLWQTPSSIVASKVRFDKSPSQPAVAVPQARGSYQARDLEESERERGNAEFKAGNFTAATKCYTKCLGMKARNYVAFSNRAMAYLKLKEYARAVSDCNCALLIEPGHVKSLLRRSTAYNALGKHRAALRDLQVAAALEPANKQVRSDLLHTREQLRNAVSRAPLVPLQAWADDRPETDDATDVSARLQGPDPRPPSLPIDAPVESADVSAEGLTAIALPPFKAEENAESTRSSADFAQPPAAPAVTRVPISFDGGEDSDGGEGEEGAGDTEMHRDTAAAPATVSMVSAQSSADTQSPKRATASAAAGGTTTAGSAVTQLSAAKEKRSGDSKKPVAELPAIRSSYDLERELKLASKDVSAVGRLLKRLKLSQVGKVLYDLMEPSVLHLLLISVDQYYGKRKRQYAKVADWFAAVRDCKRFPSQYALLGNELKVELRAVLVRLREQAVAADSGGAESVPTVAVMDALLSAYQ